MSGIVEVKPTVIVYGDEPQGTAVPTLHAQSEAIDRFEPFHVRFRSEMPLGATHDRVHFVDGPGLLGNLQRARFRFMGPSRETLAAISLKRPALVHAHYGSNTASALSIAAGLNVPVVTTFYGFHPAMAEFGITATTGAQQKLAARFLCSSQHIREQLIKIGFPAAKLQVHHAGIDTEFYAADPKITREPIILFVGQLNESTASEVLVRAMFQVEGVVPNARVVLIGDGPLRPKVESFAKRYRRQIEVLGTQSAESVRNWMNRASVFCTPSLGDDVHGGTTESGMTYAAAQSMGLPIVGYASGSIPEFVGPEGAGLLVKDNDWEAIARNILGLLLTQSTWTRYSRAAEARARNLFDVRKQAGELEAIYQGVVEDLKPWSPPVSGMPYFEAPESVYSSVSA